MTSSLWPCCSHASIRRTWVSLVHHVSDRSSWRNSPTNHPTVDGLPSTGLLVPEVATDRDEQSSEAVATSKSMSPINYQQVNIKQEQTDCAISRTEHYRKNKKPKLEKQRRDAINSCTETLRDLIFDYPGGREKSSKMEKRLIMEEVVKYVIRAKQREKLLMMLAHSNPALYISEVNKCLVNTGVDVSLGHKETSYLHHAGLIQNQLFNNQRRHSSGSSTYDSDGRDSSPSPSNHSSDVWRPF